MPLRTWAAPPRSPTSIVPAPMTARPGTLAGGPPQPQANTFTPGPRTAYIVEVRAFSGAAHPLGKASSITTTPITKPPDPTDAELAITGGGTSVSEGSSINVRITLNQPAPTGGASVRWYVADGTTVPRGSITGDLAITESLDSESRYRAAVTSGDTTVTISIPHRRRHKGGTRHRAHTFRSR